MQSLSFFVPALPRAVLSSNGDEREPRNRYTKGHAKREIGELALVASCEAYPDAPLITTRVDVTCVFYVRPSRSAACKRCLRRAIEHQGSRWNFNGDCLCYRPTDPTNIGGEVTKSIVDYGVSGGPEPKTRIPRLISDDHHRFVRFSVTGVEIVETLEEEGVLVTVSPVQDV